MVWPVDDLTKTHLDEATDSPASARQELEDLVDKVKAILAEITAGETVWHTGNDGPGTGLHADYLDNQHGSYYRDASNLNAGTISASRLPAGAGSGVDADLLEGQHGSFYQNAGNINGGTLSASRLPLIDNTKIAIAAVHQVHIATGYGEVTVIDEGFTGLALPGGYYGFYPQLKNNGSYANEARIITNHSTTLSSFIALIALKISGDVSAQLTAAQRYVSSSPPHKIGDVDYSRFIFLLVRGSKIKAIYSADDPPWYNNGPTRVEPEFYGSDGYSYILDPQSSKKRGRKPGVPKGPNDGRDYIRITPEYKNSDIDVIPHPFTDANPGDKVVLIDPTTADFQKIVDEYEASNQSVNELFYGNYVKIGEEVSTSNKPRGTQVFKPKWVNNLR